MFCFRLNKPALFFSFFSTALICEIHLPAVLLACLLFSVFCQILPAFHVIPFSNMSAEAAAFAERIPEPLLPDQVSERVQYTHTAAARAVGYCSHDTIIGSIGDTAQKDTHTQGACTERGRRGSGACSGDNFNKNDNNNDNNSGNKNENDTENVVGNDPENVDGSDGGDEGRVNLRGPRVPKALSSEALNSGHPHRLPKTRHMSRMF